MHDSKLVFTTQEHLWITLPGTSGNAHTKFGEPYPSSLILSPVSLSLCFSTLLILLELLLQALPSGALFPLFFLPATLLLHLLQDSYYQRAS